jgi:hypothetical protein
MSNLSADPHGRRVARHTLGGYRLRIAASGGNEEMYVDTIGSRVRSSKRVGAGVSAALKRRVRQLCSGRADPPADERIRGLATDVAQKLDRGDPVEVIAFDR